MKGFNVEFGRKRIKKLDCSIAIISGLTILISTFGFVNVNVPEVSSAFQGMFLISLFIFIKAIIDIRKYNQNKDDLYRYM